MLGNIVRLAVSILICLGTGASGVILTTGKNLNDWYGQLNKPWFNPPNWVFGPVWTVLYILIGVATFLIWQKGANHRPVRIALGLFALQLVFNVLWTPLFFGQHWIGVAFVEIVVLWLAILAVIIAFHRVSGLAALCLYPYIGWVSFAAILNASLWWLNR
jgi:tryptophan-rich sensory protein